MTIIDTLTDSLSFGQLVEKAPTSENSTSQSDTDSLGQVFDSFLSLIQSDDQSDTESAADDPSNTLSAITDPIESIQQGLMAALSLNSFGGSTLAELTSDESIANLQNAFLVSLQANLFSASDTGSDTTANDSANVSDVVESSDFIEDIENLTSSFLGDGKLEIKDVFDTVNILNHVPIVADIYEETMSTNVAPVSSIVGSYMYGGAIGLGYAVANLAVENFTGESIYSNLAGFFFDDEQQAAVESTTEALAENINQTNDAYQFVKRTF